MLLFADFDGENWEESFAANTAVKEMSKLWSKTNYKYDVCTVLICCD